MAVSSSPALYTAARKSFFGESLDLSNFMKTLERLQEEIGHCLSGLALLQDSLLGSWPKLSGSRPKPRTQLASLGVRVPRPKPKMSTGSPSAPAPSTLAHDPKGKAPLVVPINHPKSAFKAKVCSGPRPILDPPFSLGSGDPGASTSSLKASPPVLDASKSAPSRSYPLSAPIVRDCATQACLFFFGLRGP